MKKKLMAILLTAVMVMSMASSAFAADVKVEATPAGLVDQIKATAEWIAAKGVQGNDKATPKDIVITEYQDAFLVASSGAKSETISTFLSQFVGAVEDELAANGGKLVVKDAEARPLLYAGVINALAAIGENPASIGGYNLLNAFATAAGAEWESSVTHKENLGDSPYSFAYVVALLNKYKANINNGSELLSKVLAYGRNKLFLPDGKKDGVVYISDPSIDTYSALSLEDAFDGGESIFTGFAQGTMEYYDGYKTRVATIGQWYKDPGGYYRVDGSSKDTVLEAIKDKVKNNKDVILIKDSSGSDTYYITVGQLTPGVGMYYAGFAADNNAKLYEILHTDADANEINEALLKTLRDYMHEDGSVAWEPYETNPDSTGLTLAALSIAGDKANAAKVYAGLAQFYDESTGSFKSGDRGLATRDALEGIISYYRLLTGQNDIYSYQAVTLEEIKGKDVEAYKATDKDGNVVNKFEWSGKKPGDGVTFKTEAPIIEFVGLSIGGNRVPNKFLTLAEGSTLVTVSNDYLSGLESGEYEVKIESLNGYAVTTLKVEAVKSPNTGDANMILLFAALAIISGMGLAVYGKKRYMR